MIFLLFLFISFANNELESIALYLCTMKKTLLLKTYHINFYEKMFFLRMINLDTSKYTTRSIDH